MVKIVDDAGAVLFILRYLTSLDEKNQKESEKWDTVYSITRKAFPNVQRDKRVRDLLNGMVPLELVIHDKRKDNAYYRITDKGKDFYKSRLKSTLETIKNIVNYELNNELRQS
jgi:predicted transcriptional regulator